MLDEKSLIVKFCEDVLNDNNRYSNAHVYFDGSQKGMFIDEIVAFERNHKKLYNKLLIFCAENDLMILKTDKLTYATTVRTRITE